MVILAVRDAEEYVQAMRSMVTEPRKHSRERGVLGAVLAEPSDWKNAYQI